MLTTAVQFYLTLQIIQSGSIGEADGIVVPSVGLIYDDSRNPRQAGVYIVNSFYSHTPPSSASSVWCLISETYLLSSVSACICQISNPASRMTQTFPRQYHAFLFTVFADLMVLGPTYVIRVQYPVCLCSNFNCTATTTRCHFYHR